MIIRAISFKVTLSSAFRTRLVTSLPKMYHPAVPMVRTLILMFNCVKASFWHSDA